jgi:ABC-2 type transport system permease protein
MRTLLFLLQKEFRQVFRDPSIIRLIFVMPSIQLLVLPWAADYEVKNISLAVIDHDHSAYTQKLISKITASGYFHLDQYTASYTDALHEIEHDNADIILEIPASFEKDFVKEEHNNLFIAVNAINGTKAGLGAAYLQTILTDFSQDIRLKWMQQARFNQAPAINVTYSNWFNPLMNYKYFMVPGIIVILLTMLHPSKNIISYWENLFLSGYSV